MHSLFCHYNNNHIKFNDDQQTRLNIISIYFIDLIYCLAVVIVHASASHSLSKL